MKLTITAAPLPSNFIGTPQQLFEAILDRLEIASEGSSFVISDVQPATNEGPWLRGGKEWWVWDNSTSTYVPLDISASSTPQIFIGDIAGPTPDPTKYSLWMQLSGTVVLGLYYYAGTVAGWVRQPSELLAQAISLDKIANQAAGSLITFNTSSAAVTLPPGPVGTFLQSLGNTLGWGTPPAIHGIPTFITPALLISGSSGAAVAWATLSALETPTAIHPPLSALIISVFAEESGSGVRYISVRANQNGGVYKVATGVSGGTGVAAMINQAMIPVTVVGNSFSFDYSMDAGFASWSIYAVGYIT
jgi:hypothetical protein